MVCARALYALSDDESSEEVIEKGLYYLERCQISDGSFPAKTGVYTDAAGTAYTLIILNKFHYSKASLIVSRGIMWLLEHQGPDGSWSGRNSRKNAYTTSLCLRAMHTYYLNGLSWYRLGLVHLLEQLSDPRFWEEPVSHVYAPVLNLQRIGLMTDELRKSFIEFSEEHINAAIAAGQTADIAYLCGTLAAIKGGPISQCTEYIESAQNADGGFGKDKSRDSNPNWTALAILALGNRL